jgi:hypothetical protein
MNDPHHGAEKGFSFTMRSVSIETAWRWDGTTGPGTGSKVLQLAFSGRGSPSAGETATFAATDSEFDSFTESKSDIVAQRSGGLYASGWDVSFGTANSI